MPEADAIQWMAFAYRELGDLEQAEDCQRKVVAITSKHCGRATDSMQTALTRLGDLMILLGKIAEAQVCFSTALQDVDSNLQADAWCACLRSRIQWTEERGEKVAPIPASPAPPWPLPTPRRIR